VEAVDNVPVRYRSNVFFGGRLVYSQRDIPGAAAGQGLEQFYVTIGTCFKNCNECRTIRIALGSPSQ